MENQIINHWAVFVAAISNLLIGALWYSPILFYKAWKKENDLSDEQIQTQNSIKVYGLTFVISLVMSYNLAFFLADSSSDPVWGATAGFLTGFGWATAIFSIIALFEQRSVRYILINSGFIVLYFTLAGLIVGTWK